MITFKNVSKEPNHTCFSEHWVRPTQEFWIWVKYHNNRVYVAYTFLPQRTAIKTAIPIQFQVKPTNKNHYSRACVRRIHLFKCEYRIEVYAIRLIKRTANKPRINLKWFDDYKGRDINTAISKYDQYFNYWFAIDDTQKYAHTQHTPSVGLCSFFISFVCPK